MRFYTHSVFLLGWVLLGVPLLGAGGCGVGAEGPDAHRERDERRAPACPIPEPLWGDIDLDTFEVLPALEDLDFSRVMPAAPPTYWELRFATPGDFEVLGSAGTKCAEAPDPAACRAAFDALSADTGFAIGCPPAFCYHYVAVNRGAENRVITTASELTEFLGTIDNATEAALVAFAAGYDWSPSDPSVSSVRAVPGGFELLVRDLVSFCVPVQTDRFLLFVSTDGAIEVRRRNVFSVACNACI